MLYPEKMQLRLVGLEKTEIVCLEREGRGKDRVSTLIAGKTTRTDASRAVRYQQFHETRGCSIIHSPRCTSHMLAYEMGDQTKTSLTFEGSIGRPDLHRPDADSEAHYITNRSSPRDRQLFSAVVGSLKNAGVQSRCKSWRSRAPL